MKEGEGRGGGSPFMLANQPINYMINALILKERERVYTGKMKEGSQMMQEEEVGSWKVGIVFFVNGKPFTVLYRSMLRSGYGQMF